jgi:HTH-type transcriptional regulator/antitoxin HigA
MPPDPDAFGPALTGMCAEVGVAVGFGPAPQGRPAGGASRWLSPAKALLMLSNRTRTHDVLWFTFFRGIRRLLWHGGRMIVGEGARGLGAGIEEEGDAFAGQLLILPADARRIRELARDAEAMASFAREMGWRRGSGRGGCGSSG